MNSQEKSEDNLKNLVEAAQVLDQVDENGYLPNSPLYSPPKGRTVVNYTKDRSQPGKKRRKARRAL